MESRLAILTAFLSNSADDSQSHFHLLGWYLFKPQSPKKFFNKCRWWPPSHHIKCNLANYTSKKTNSYNEYSSGKTTR